MKNLITAIVFFLSVEGIAQTYPSVVVSFNQALDNNNNPIQLARSNPAKALGVPQNSDAASSPINYVSLGFGGSITVGFTSPIPVTPNTVLNTYETTYNYTCDQYPETSQIYVSKDGTDYFLVGESCGSNSLPLQLYGIVDSVKYIRVEDVSILSEFSMFVGADGYDLDGIEIFTLDPLAIEVGSFKIVWDGAKIYVDFETLSESNTWKFDVQVSDDAVNFRDLIRFDGAGWSSSTRKYTGSVAFEPTNAISYFRLKEIDYNGEVSYYNLTQVVTKPNNFHILLNYDLAGRLSSDRQGFFIPAVKK
jgi:hypothetical protein